MTCFPLPLLPGGNAFVNDGSKLPVLAVLIGSLKSSLGRRSPHCRDDFVWEWAQLKAGTQGTSGNSSVAPTIVGSQWEKQVTPNF